MPRLPSRKTEDRIDTPLRGPAFLFDLDGTLVDSVYQHVLAWPKPCKLRDSSWRCGVSIAASE